MTLAFPVLNAGIYIAHGLFWTVFWLTRLALRSVGETSPPPSTAVAAKEGKVAPFSRALIAFHAFGFGVLYMGINFAVAFNHAGGFAGERQRVGAGVIAAATGLAVWALLSFRSWRIRAKLEPGHQLATGGPFGWVRNPVYLALDLLALGSAIWIQTPLVWVGCGLIVLAGDLRARAEEKLLAEAFGAAFREYRERTRRFVPGIY